MQPTYITLQHLTNHQPHHSFRMFFGQPAGHGPVHTDENHAVITPPAKAGNNTYSFHGAGGIRKETLSGI